MQGLWDGLTQAAQNAADWAPHAPACSPSYAWLGICDQYGNEWSHFHAPADVDPPRAVPLARQLESTPFAPSPAGTAAHSSVQPREFTFNDKTWTVLQHTPGDVLVALQMPDGAVLIGRQLSLRLGLSQVWILWTNGRFMAAPWLARVAACMPAETLRAGN